MAGKIGVRINFNNLQQHIRDSPLKVDQALRALAQEGENHAKMLIQQSPATGRTYGNHIASSPGNPPRSETGNLINAIHWLQTGSLAYELRDGTNYGFKLEFILNRPFMTPTAKHLEEVSGEIFEQFLK